ncbi:MAG: PilZ domain-containing protein [Pelovirga sp.]
MNLTANVRIDIARNRLYCTFAEKSTAQELAELSADIQRRVPELEPGFDVVEDMSRCHLFQLAALPTLRNIMHYLVNRGAREVIRVVDKKSTVFRQFTNLSVRLRSYKPIYVSSMAEADDLLNQSQRRSGLRFDLPNTWITVHTETGAFNAKAVDISANGCAIITDEEPLSVGTEVRLKLPLKNEKGVTLAFEIPAGVVRCFEGGFAVNFSEFDGTTKDEFMNCLIHELKQQND